MNPSCSSTSNGNLGFSSIISHWCRPKLSLHGEPNVEVENSSLVRNIASEQENCKAAYIPYSSLSGKGTPIALQHETSQDREDAPMPICEKCSRRQRREEALRRILYGRASKDDAERQQSQLPPWIPSPCRSTSTTTRRWSARPPSSGPQPSCVAVPHWAASEAYVDRHITEKTLLHRFSADTVPSTQKQVLASRAGSQRRGKRMKKRTKTPSTPRPTPGRPSTARRAGPRAEGENDTGTHRANRRRKQEKQHQQEQEYPQEQKRQARKHAPRSSLSTTSTQPQKPKGPKPKTARSRRRTRSNTHTAGNADSRWVGDVVARAFLRTLARQDVSEFMMIEFLDTIAASRRSCSSSQPTRQQEPSPPPRLSSERERETGNLNLISPWKTEKTRSHWYVSADVSTTSSTPSEKDATSRHVPARRTEDVVCIQRWLQWRAACHVVQRALEVQQSSLTDGYGTHTQEEEHVVEEGNEPLLCEGIVKNALDHTKCEATSRFLSPVELARQQRRQTEIILERYFLARVDDLTSSETRARSECYWTEAAVRAELLHCVVLFEVEAVYEEETRRESRTRECILEVLNTSTPLPQLNLPLEHQVEKLLDMESLKRLDVLLSEAEMRLDVLHCILSLLDTLLRESLRAEEDVDRKNLQVTFDSIISTLISTQEAPVSTCLDLAVKSDEAKHEDKDCIPLTECVSLNASPMVMCEKKEEGGGCTLLILMAWEEVKPSLKAFEEMKSGVILASDTQLEHSPIDSGQKHASFDVSRSLVESTQMWNDSRTISSSTQDVEEPQIDSFKSQLNTENVTESVSIHTSHTPSDYLAVRTPWTNSIDDSTTNKSRSPEIMDNPGTMPNGILYEQQQNGVSTSVTFRGTVQEASVASPALPLSQYVPTEMVQSPEVNDLAEA